MSRLGAACKWLWMGQDSGTKVVKCKPGWPEGRARVLNLCLLSTVCCNLAAWLVAACATENQPYIPIFPVLRCVLPKQVLKRRNTNLSVNAMHVFERSRFGLRKNTRGVWGRAAASAAQSSIPARHFNCRIRLIGLSWCFLGCSSPATFSIVDKTKKGVQL